MVEQKGFELSVRFCNAKCRCVRKLQTARWLRQNLGRKNPIPIICESSFYSPSIRIVLAKGRLGS